jgi:hypothetical protein
MKFPVDKAGRKAKCPKCNAILTVPKAEEANGPAGAPAAVADEGDGAYGVVIDHELQERRARIEEEDRLRKKELAKKKAPKIKKKFKSLPEGELWEKVHFGLLFIFLGTCIWAFTHLLQGMWVGLGVVEFQDYGRLVTELIERQREGHPNNDVVPEGGKFWDFSQFHLLVSMVSGRTFSGFAKFCIIVNLILYPLQALLWFVGYILCLPVPRHHNTLGLLITLMVLAVFNFLIFLFFRVIPVTGLYRYYLIPYFIPELLFTEYNMERVYPYYLLWSGAPFWESVLSIFLQFMYFLQPILGCSFLWSCVTTLKDKRVEEAAGGVTAVGFGQLYVWLALLMIALCGTTPVLVNVLRVLYIMWFSFLLMFIIRYALLIWRCRDLIDYRLNPEGS